LRVGQRHAGGGERFTDQRRVAADQDDGPRVPPHDRCERREVLALADAARDQHAAFAEARQRGDGGADVRAFAVVVVLDVVDHRDQPAAVRAGFEIAQPAQHRREWNAGGTQQCQRRQRIGVVVRAMQPQGFNRHQPVQVEAGSGGRAAAAHAVVVVRQRLHQPAEAAVPHQAEGRGAQRRGQREGRLRQQERRGLRRPGGARRPPAGGRPCATRRLRPRSWP
jgi:hypothetical protein